MASECLSPLSFGQEQFWRLIQNALTRTFRESPNVTYLEKNFDREAMVSAVENLIRRYSGISLKKITNRPEQQTPALSTLSEADRHRLLVEWNETGEEYPERDLCLHELIERQVKRFPGQTAVMFEQQKLTYARMNQQANRLAHCLREKGIGPESRVGLFVERSVEMVVGILGILKAGGAYVPIDASFPRERVVFMLEDAKAVLLLTQRSLLGSLREGVPEAICLDEFDWGGGEELAQGNSGAGPQNLAYVIYTSGSTGRPKGVCIEHRNIVNYVLGVVERFHFEAGMNHAMVSTIAADLCNTVVFPSLVTGGCLHVISQERAQSHGMLGEYFERERIDVLKIVPSHLAALQAAGDAQKVMPRARLILGGEGLWSNRVKQLRDLSPGCEIFNEYGPTEATVGVVVYQVGAQLPETASGTLPSGRPLPNSRAYILDEQGQPVPVGVVGELCIGGKGIGRGYLGHPELTAEKFVPDPFGPDGSGRIYRTGDRARYLEDGNIEFLGRVDNQVKIHGYRVELGEIERAIREQQGVRDVVVTVNGDDYSNKELVAYVVRDGHMDDSQYAPWEISAPSSFRKLLKQRLPQHMIPSTFVVMEKLPLTSNGKIDRDALPAPVAFSDVTTEYVAPRDALEQLLADIWAKVLKLERVGIHDDFFDLGGHSLMAVRLIAEFERLSEKRLPLAMLLQAPTIAGLAGLLRSESHDPGWSSLVPIEASGLKPPLFLAHEGDGSVMLYKQLARHLGQEQPVYGLQSQGLKDDGYIHRTVEEMASHYIKEVRNKQPRGPYYLGGYCLGGTIALEMAQQLRARGERVALVVMIDTYNLCLIPQAKLRRLEHIHMLQSFWFLTVNFLAANKGERIRFLQRKWDILRMRFETSVRAWLNNLRSWSKLRKSASEPYVEVKSANHQAMKKYVPKPYFGRVLLIRPKGDFLGENDPALGWREVLGGQVDVRMSTAYPKGIMVDPYLRTLAQDLKAYLLDVHLTENHELSESGKKEIESLGRVLDGKQMARIMAGLELAVSWACLASLLWC